MGEWRGVSLYEIAEYINGRPTKPAEVTSTGVPVIKIAELNRGITDNTNRVAAQLVEDKHWVSPGDLLFAWSGSVGVYKYSGPRAALNQHIFRVISKSNVDQEFLRYLLLYKLPTFLSYAENKKTTMGHVTIKDLQRTLVRIPPLSEQRAIAEVLGALDDKIEGNRKVMEMLDRAFQLKWRQLYKHPDCNRHCVLGDIVDTQYGFTASASTSKSGIKFLRVTDINKSNWINWSAVPTVSVDDSIKDKYILRKGELLVARMADPGKSAIYEDEQVPAIFASYLVRLKPATYEEGLFIFGFLKSAEYLNNYAVGATTGSVQKHMNARIIVNTVIRLPDRQALMRFGADVIPIREMLTALVKENDKLMVLRDTLLPKLLSGELKVKDAESIVEEVT